MKEITDIKINELLYCPHCKSLFQTTFGDRIDAPGGSSTSPDGNSKCSYTQFTCPKCKTQIKQEIATLKYPEGYEQMKLIFITQ